VEKGLIQAYHKALTQRGIAASEFSFEQCWEAYTNHVALQVGGGGGGGGRGEGEGGRGVEGYDPPAAQRTPDSRVELVPQSGRSQGEWL
jgi:hypothetical protein